MTIRASAWLKPLPHDDQRSLDLVRLTVAVILATHAVHALAHPADVTTLAHMLAARGLPRASVLAWGAVGVGLAGALALGVKRLVVPAALASMALVGAGALLLHAPRWYVIGGSVVDGYPGVEFDVLTLACLAGVSWAYRAAGAADRSRAARQGFDVVRIASAFALLMHGSVFVTWDFAGMRGWGEQMTAAGWPHGVALVWSIKVGEFVAALLRLSRRLVVPACFVHLSYIVPALWIEHEMKWFDVGPGENGIEFPLLIVVCTVACILAYWPVRGASVQPAHAEPATGAG